MIAIEVFTGDGIMSEVAVIEFLGERTETYPDGSGAARIYNPNSEEPKGYRFRSGSVPDDVVQEIYRGVCQMKATDKVGQYTWRR